MKRLFGVLALMGGVCLSGCGGSDGADSGPPAMKGTVNASGARTVTSTAMSMNTELMSTNTNGASVAGQVNQISVSGAQQVVSPNAGSVKALTSALLNLPQAPAAGTSGTVTCDTSGCTYDQFMAGGLTYDGSIKATDAGSGAKKVTANLTMKGTQAGTGSVSQEIDWTITADCTLSASSINGFFQAVGKGTISGVNSPGAPSTLSYTYFNQVKFNSVTLSNGTATGGSLYAKWGITVNGTSAGSQAWEGTVTFPQ